MKGSTMSKKSEREQFLASIGHPIADEMADLRRRFLVAKASAQDNRKLTVIINVENVSLAAVNLFVLEKTIDCRWTSKLIRRGGELTNVEFN